MTQTTAPQMIKTHLWQEQGLGAAPFHVHCVISFPSKSLCEANPNAYNLAAGEACQQAKALGVHLCSCYSCGMSLEHNVVIRDANKKFFVVGMDCAMKTGDTQIMTQVEYLEKKRQQAIRDKKSAEAYEARQAAWRAKDDAERAVNGGMTNREIAAQQRLDAQNAVIAENKVKYAWLIKPLCEIQYSSDFINNMLDKIEKFGAQGLSEKCINIICDIYAKQVSGSKRGSKKYNAALDECGERIRA